MIEDKELRGLFKAESAEHLQALEGLLLRLEKSPEDASALEEALREAHSIKGSARMLGVKDVELVAHRVESLFASAKKGDERLTTDLIDRICMTLDAVKKLVGEAVSGEPSGVNVQAVLKMLGEGAGGAEKKTSDRPGPVPESGGKAGADASKQGISSVEAPEFRIDTVRVDTRRLDELMTGAGELTLIKTRLLKRFVDAEEAVDVWEDAVKAARRAPGGAVTGLERLGERLKGLLNAVYEDSSRLELIANELEEGIRNIRLLPFSTLFSLFPRMVRDMAREKGKEARLEVEGADTGADKRIIEEMKDPLTHMVRNSIDHGIEPPDERERAGKPPCGTIRLRAERAAEHIMLEVFDDGRGLDIEAIKRAALKKKIKSAEELEGLPDSEIKALIFSSGLSTSRFITDISGRGVGLDVVRANIERLKGSISVESAPGRGCAIRVRLPVTLAAARVLIARAAGRSYAIPMESVETSLMVSDKDVFSIEGRDAISLSGGTVSVMRLREILGLPGAGTNGGPSPCVIIYAGEERLGVLADELVDEQEVVLKTASAVLKRVRNVSGYTILGSGEICTVLNPHDMIRGAKKRALAPPPHIKTAGEEGRKAVLLVEDSITTRTQEKRILEAGGFEVVTAVNGVDALGKLSERRFDAVVSDILMPEMDGLTLTGRIRMDKRYRDLPVILVTTLATDEDKRRGLEAGASAYIPKPTFDQKVFLETLRRLV